MELDFCVCRKCLGAVLFIVYLVLIRSRLQYIKVNEYSVFTDEMNVLLCFSELNADKSIDCEHNNVFK